MQAALHKRPRRPARQGQIDVRDEINDGTVCQQTTDSIEPTSDFRFVSGHIWTQKHSELDLKSADTPVRSHVSTRWYNKFIL